MEPRLSCLLHPTFCLSSCLDFPLWICHWHLRHHLVPLDPLDLDFTCSCFAHSIFFCAIISVLSVGWVRVWAKASTTESLLKFSALWGSSHHHCWASWPSHCSPAQAYLWEVGGINEITTDWGILWLGLISAIRGAELWEPLCYCFELPALSSSSTGSIYEVVWVLHIRRRSDSQSLDCRSVGRCGTGRENLHTQPLAAIGSTTQVLRHHQGAEPWLINPVQECCVLLGHHWGNGEVQLHLSLIPIRDWGASVLCRSWSHWLWDPSVIAMDSLDGILAMECLTLATDDLVPYVLSWTLDPESREPAEASVLVIMRRTGGVLLVVPASFLPMVIVEQGNAGSPTSVFGPSVEFEVPAMLADGGIVSQTGGTVLVRVIDCTEGIMSHLREFMEDEEVTFLLRRGLSFCFPFNRCFGSFGEGMGHSHLRAAGSFLLTQGDGGPCGRRCNSAATKTSCQKGYSFRKWAKGKAGHHSRAVHSTGGSFGAAATNVPAADFAEYKTTEVGRSAAHTWQECSSGGSSTFGSSVRFASATCFLTCKDSAASPTDCCSSEPWFVGVPWTRETSGARGIGRRESGPRTQICPDFWGCFSPGCFGPITGTDKFGRPDSTCSRRSHERADILGRRWCPRSIWPSKASSRAGATEGTFLPCCPAEHVTSDVSNQFLRCLSPRTFESWCFWSTLLGDSEDMADRGSWASYSSRSWRPWTTWWRDKWMPPWTQWLCWPWQWNRHVWTVAGWIWPLSFVCKRMHQPRSLSTGRWWAPPAPGPSLLWPTNDGSLATEEMHFSRSPSNAPRLPSFLEMLENPHVLLTLDKVHNPLRLPKCSVPVSFLHFWLRNVHRATTACTFSTCQLPEVVRAWCVLYILTSKCASRHNGVHFFDISTSKSGPNMVCFVHLTSKCASPQHFFDIATSKSSPNMWCFLHFHFEMCFAPQWLRRFSEPTFRPSGATNHWKKHSVSRLSYLFAHMDLLSSETFSFLIFFLLLLFSDSSHLSFSSVHIVGSLLNFLRQLKLQLQLLQLQLQLHK